MSTAPQYRPHYTVDDYQLWEGEWELWNGTAVAMTPSPFGRHASINGRIVTAFNNAIDSAGCDATALVEIDWIVARDTVLRPDLTIVCGGAPEKHVEETPALVVEILSAATRERDETFKKAVYQQNGVSWYLIADPENNSLQPLKLNPSGVYEPVSFSETLAVDICDGCALSVKVDRLFD